MVRFAFASILIAAAACGGATPKPAGPEPVAGPDLSPALAPVRWIVGDWEHEAGREHWTAVAGVFYGVAFHAEGGFEAMLIDDATEDAPGQPDGTLRFYAIPSGAAETLFTATGAGADALRFENPQHDDPTSIEYTPADQGLSSTVTGARGEQVLSMASFDGERADDAVAADAAFARATDANRADGWVDSFAEDGAMIRGGQRVEGADAIRGVIAPLLAQGDLLWSPTWSRLSANGQLAATAGHARLVHEARVVWRGSYLTVWRATAEGWKVVLDVGRSENPLQ